jgi:peptide/nickel transport system permease protein
VATTAEPLEEVARVAPPARGLRARPSARRRVVVALGVLAFMVALALLADVLSPYDPDAQLSLERLAGHPPSLLHPMGNDPYSRDILSRVLHGTRVSLGVAALALAVAMGVGTAYGALAGMAGDRVDALLMRLVDALLSIPRVLLLIMLVALWGQITVPRLVVFLGLTSWFGVSRLVRGEVRALREREFVLAARALGAGGPAIFRRHLLPNLATPLLVSATLVVRTVILLEAGLSFFGYGVPQPTASWGSIIRDGADQVATHWWITVFPGLAIVLTVLALDALGDGLREALDPRQLPRP